jgi:MerR family transcriptional regulator, repressor of the yfmOP operon
VTIDPDPSPERLLRIQEVAAEAGLTTRAVRYYEEIGLLRPAARSDGDYRLYDASDQERLRFIKALRDDAGFSLAEIGQLLEDEAAREVARARFNEVDDAGERRAIVAETLDRVDRQVATLQDKAERLAAMIREAEARREHLLEHLAELDAGRNGRHARGTKASVEGATS